MRKMYALILMVICSLTYAENTKEIPKIISAEEGSNAIVEKFASAFDTEIIHFKGFVINYKNANYMCFSAGVDIRCRKLETRK